MSNGNKTSFEFEGSQTPAPPSSAAVSQEDVTAALSQPQSRSEKAALAAEKTKGTFKALKDKFSAKLNGIKSEKVRTAIIYGGGAIAIVVLLAVGFLVGNLIYSNWLNSRNRDTLAEIAALSSESSELLFGATDEEKAAFAEKVEQKVEELEARNDENLWQALLVQSSSQFNNGQYAESIATKRQALETAPEIERLDIYTNIYSAYNMLGDKQGMISTIEEMLERDVFTNSKDPMAEFTRTKFTNELATLRGQN